MPAIVRYSKNAKKFLRRNRHIIQQDDVDELMYTAVDILTGKKDLSLDLAQ